ncbi:hypothetical protein CH92_03650 [Stutzerimonas stutzeri]|uniref:Uncharacterized protein n=1 Tax=Stutzerimonas stutzeri TaxID=316 RepID=W8R3W6_STUST|nr:hypothetical protein CH92_03650 [Stutzerimonas stutzeri]
MPWPGAISLNMKKTHGADVLFFRINLGKRFCSIERDLPARDGIVMLPRTDAQNDDLQPMSAHATLRRTLRS